MSSTDNSSDENWAENVDAPSSNDDDDDDSSFGGKKRDSTKKQSADQTSSSTKVKKSIKTDLKSRQDAKEDTKGTKRNTLDIKAAQQSPIQSISIDALIATSASSAPPCASAINHKKRRHHESTVKDPEKLKLIKQLSLDNGNCIEDPALLISANRLTKDGGYRHLNASKLKISVANRGNTPWNKGMNRSSTVKAKISSGVKARNRKVLLERLQKFGLTEDEYLLKKKQIKSLRNRLLVAKKQSVEFAKATVQEREKEQVTREAWAITDRQERQQIREQEAEMQRKYDEQVKILREQAHVISMEKAKVEFQALKDHMSAKSLQQGGAFPGCFTKDYIWKDHLFDNKSVSYKDVCPTGGPGGLICCAQCTVTYSSYLSQTRNDLQEQKIGQTSLELAQLLDILCASRPVLSKTIQAARRLPPPLTFPIGVKVATRKRRKRKDIATDTTVEEYEKVLNKYELARERVAAKYKHNDRQSDEDSNESDSSGTDEEELAHIETKPGYGDDDDVDDDDDDDIDVASIVVADDFDTTNFGSRRIQSNPIMDDVENFETV